MTTPPRRAARPLRLLRNRAIGLARRALLPVTVWRSARTPRRLPLASVRRRLELLLAAMYGRPFTVGEKHAGTPVPGAAPDVLLPPMLDAAAGPEAATERYRFLAIQQAERLVRGSAAAAPTDRLELDLFELAEGASIDRSIAARAPGLVDLLTARRRSELAARPRLARVRETERPVEAMLQALLALAPDDYTPDVPGVQRTRTAAESHAWAREEAARLRARLAPGTRYAGVRPVGLWRLGTGQPFDLAAQLGRLTGDQRSAATAAPSPSGKQAGERDERGDAAGEPAADGADATSATVSAAAAESAGDQPGGATVSRPAERERLTAPGGIRYPEWDEYASHYRPNEVTVRAAAAGEIDDAWALATLHAHAPLVRQIRARFAPLRARRLRLRAQRSGDELDLDACVESLVELRRGGVPSDRLYRLTKPARRSLAIMLLVDVSGSTKTLVADGRTVLDVERLTLLLASEALDELGDPYAVLAFSGTGRHDVQVNTVKAFADQDPSAVRRRVAALRSARHTRLGAALRHATALLNAQPAERRLLLLLSDGQPNDIEGYQGSYAMADSRRAVLEARASGAHLFCLTVDREEQEYLPHLFGTTGYRILREPAQLPAALLQVVTQLLPS